MKMQQGFTLIELVVVIVILGILSATAIPKFVDLSDEAEDAAMQGVVGAINSASAINYAACKAGSSSCVTVNDCNDILPALQGGALPTGYSISNTTIANDATVNCAVSKSGVTSVNAQVIGT